MFAAATVAQGNHVVHGADDTLYVEFFHHPVQDKKATDEAGRPIFKEVPYVRINIPGDKTTEVRRKVKDSDKIRFPRQWAQFEANQKQVIEGTPLDQWPALNSAQVMEFKHLNIHTVEQLAALNDSNLRNLGTGGQALKAKAHAYIEAAQGNAPTEKLAAENEALKGQVAALQEQMKALADRVDEKRKRSKKEDA